MRVKSEGEQVLFRRLPSVDEVLRYPSLAEAIARYGRQATTDAARNVLADLRRELTRNQLDEQQLAHAIDAIAENVERSLHASQKPSLRPVINATGIVLHTNLGRAPLAKSAIEQIAGVCSQYSNLEFDLITGARGKRDVHAQRLFEQLFASDGLDDISTIAVNNNAAAVLLALNSVASGGEVIVSRGELVEIGGSFRVPDVMSRSGAILHEVGTTNRTRIGDYEAAINERTRLLLRVHRSNFAIIGFTEQPTLEEMVELGRRHNIPVMEDLGSGALVRLDEFGVPGESNVYDSLRAGVDLVTYSGDKLLGGPQAGLISGASAWTSKLRSNPLFRALRLDKTAYAALEATLLLYLRRDYEALPLLRMLQLPPRSIRARCEAIADKVSSSELEAAVIATESLVGGGAAPTAKLPSYALAISSHQMAADELSGRLRAHEAAIVGRVENERVLLDLRTVFPEQDETIVEALLGIQQRSA